MEPPEIFENQEQSKELENLRSLIYLYEMIGEDTLIGYAGGTGWHLLYNQFYFMSKHRIENVFKNEDHYYNTVTVTEFKETWNIQARDLARNIRNATDNTTVYFLKISKMKGEKNHGHMSLLIYYKDTKTLYFFDPNGNCCFLHSLQFFGFLRNYIPDVRLISSQNLHIYSGVKPLDVDGRRVIVGLQNIEAYECDEPDLGFCQIWSLLFYDLIYQFRNLHITMIISQFYEELKTVENQGLFLRRLIRGFMIDSFREMKPFYKNYGFNFKMKELLGHGSDSKYERLETLIENEMAPYVST